ncbi:pantoate--beta-alanine ligase [Thermospira aquatica]|uniref:Pantothenate synthetase n=1 Tax=Thermospira aquatica TaxID=2828656 RepID=A0AAX3BAR9_9SPIR|nr:pantoate--beta-alanine ligase [Thermospira aquatica]URA09281.1 pantoate--beta-alanine ligase [Thermospira aquatica]
MQVIEKVREMQELARQWRREGYSIGFVPTMGALHEGHLSLVREARKHHDRVVVSIFVNPLQFGPSEDYNRYPRTFEEDKALLIAEGVDVIFFPSVEDLYPQNYQTYVTLERLPEHLCGLSRPGHFRGVATVVTKLFNIVMPHEAYFGKKDYQQFRIIERMVQDLNMDLKVTPMPIVREHDGLAMSSRNRYLTPQERQKALILFRSLELASDRIQKGERDAFRLTQEIRKFIQREVSEARIDYVSFVDAKTLEDIKTLSGHVLLALAVFIGTTRLIDNREFFLED